MKNVDKIISFYKKRRRMPSYRELVSILGYKTKSAAHYFVDKLIEEGIVDRDSSGRLIPKKLFGETPFLGLVEAGFPSAAEEELVDTLSFDEYLVENKEATYILRVKGDSMIEAGICQGDMVVVERTNSYRDGDIVIAEVDGEWTIKYFRKRGGKTYLEPANKKYKPIYPTEELKVAAVVRAVVRKY